jgi:hypothetical protein
MKKTGFLLLIVCQALCLSAQTNLAPFTGKYQFQDNKMNFLQITQKDGQLILKQLWDNQEITFKQTGALTFFNNDQGFPLAFTKSDKGEVVSVLAFNRDTWNKVPDNYAEPLKKIIKLTADQLKACAGKYQFKEGDGDADDFLQIAAGDDHLVLTQLWNQQKVTIWPVAPLEFFDDKQSVPITFVKDATGAVTQLVANHKDIWAKVK